MLLLRNLQRKRELCCRVKDLKGLFHAHISNYQGMSQHTSSLDCIDFFINGNVLSGLTLIFFLAMSLACITSVT